MKQITFFAISLLLVLIVSCGKEYTVPGQYSRIPGFKPDSIALYNNTPIKDSMLADFDSDGNADLSVCAYIFILGASALSQEHFFRLNTLNPDYAILSETQNDTLCTDTTVTGQLIRTHIHNCNSTAGMVLSGTYAVSSHQFLSPPAGIYQSGMLTIFHYQHLGSYMGFPTSTYDKSFGSNYNGYFFVKRLSTQKIYALKLKYKDMFKYILEDIIML